MKKKNLPKTKTPPTMLETIELGRDLAHTILREGISYSACVRLAKKFLKASGE